MKNKINETMLKKYPKLVVLLILGSTLLCMSCASSENDSLINVSGPGDVPGGGTDTSNVACSDSVQASGFNGGDGTEADPYLICNYVQLVKIRDDLSAHYRLTQNIDASSSHSEGSERDASTDGDSDCTAYNPGAAASTDAGHPNMEIAVEVGPPWEIVGTLSAADSMEQAMRSRIFTKAR